MFQDRLRFVRDRNGISQTNIASIIGIDNSRYTHYENEDDIIPIEHLIIYSNYFHVSIDYLFGMSNEKIYNNYNYITNKNISGNRLKEFRKENKLIQKELANKIKISNKMISRYETGKNLIATPFLYDICKKYNISADYLLGRSDSPKYFK